MRTWNSPTHLFPVWQTGHDCIRGQFSDEVSRRWLEGTMCQSNDEALQIHQYGLLLCLTHGIRDCVANPLWSHRHCSVTCVSLGCMVQNKKRRDTIISYIFQGSALPGPHSTKPICVCEHRHCRYTVLCPPVLCVSIDVCMKLFMIFFLGWWHPAALCQTLGSKGSGATFHECMSTNIQVSVHIWAKWSEGK